MVDACDPNDAVEGLKLQLVCQAIREAKLPKKKGGYLLFPINVYKKGRAEIIKEYPVTRESRKKEPKKKPKLCRSALLDLGDNVQGMALWGCCTKTLKRVNVGTRDARTGSHSNQEAVLEGDVCLMVIVTSWTRQSVTTHPQDMLFALSI